MGIINTTDIIDSSIFLKSNFPINMVSDNYYIENIQDKRNYDWDYRYNVVGIEEEKKKQIEYEEQIPLEDINSNNSKYTPIETVITNVKDDKGKSLGTDWAKLAFKNLMHPAEVGKRYRFSLKFPDMSIMSETEKHYDTSVWICVNRSPINAGNSCVVRRCNTSIVLLGYENRDRRRTSTREVHYEPVILDNEQLKYMQIYYNEVAPVPQSEWYMIMQLNYYTNCIKINDRIMFGTFDNEVRDNNAVYKIKAVIKSNMSTTFAKPENNGIENTPLIILALDKDAINPHDNFNAKIANNAPIYLIPDKSSISKKDVPEIDPVSGKVIIEEYTLKDTNDCVLNIPMGEYQHYGLKLYRNKVEIVNPSISYTVQLTEKAQSEWVKYFKIEYDTNGIGFTVFNLKTCLGSVLKIKATYIISEDYSINKEFEIVLDKSY